MNYDLKKTNKEDRKRFVREANRLLREERPNVSLVDKSLRTPKQNNYIHVLCRILAVDVGVTEAYAKAVYFKRLANPGIFLTTTQEPITNSVVPVVRSTKDLTIPEMRIAISNFIRWAADNGYDLPEATIKDDGSVEFASNKDKEAFYQADVETSKSEEFL